MTQETPETQEWPGGIEPPKPVTKVVLGLKEGTGSIGIQAADCDPYFKIAAVPAIEDLLGLVPEALEEAQARWSEASQNPAYDRPAPAVAAARPAQRRGRQPAAAPKPPEETTPRLF